jgi:hypothetical protein
MPHGLYAMFMQPRCLVANRPFSEHMLVYPNNNFLWFSIPASHSRTQVHEFVVPSVAISEAPRCSSTFDKEVQVALLQKC